MDLVLRSREIVGFLKPKSFQGEVYSTLFRLPEMLSGAKREVAQRYIDGNASG